MIRSRCLSTSTATRAADHARVAKLAGLCDPDRAPAACIVCARPFKDQPEGGFSYLSGSIPFGAMACVGACTAEAQRREFLFGRTDFSEEEMACRIR